MKLTRLDRLARAGYSARAVIYGLLGYLALTTSHLATKGPQGEFELLRSIPGGRGILLVLAAGLLAYGLYKLVGALLDADHHGSDIKGGAERAGAAIGGFAYLTLGWTAFRLARDMGMDTGGNGSKEAAAATLQMPLGSLALALAGAGFLLAAAVQLRSAITKRFMKYLESGAPRFTCTIGRIGLAARAIVFAVIGGSLIRAAWHEDERHVRDLGGALGALRESQLLYLAVATGLIVFAIYSAIEARYRIVPRLDPIAAGRRLAS